MQEGSFGDISERMVGTLSGRERMAAFLANSVHRLRSTLTVMRIYTELIQSGMYGQVEGEMIDKIGSLESNIDELAVYMDIIQDMNTVTSLQDDYREETDLYEVTMDVMKGLSTRQASRIQLENPVSPEPIMGMVDRNVLRKTLRNLLAYSLYNSLPETKISVVIDCGRGEPSIKVLSSAEPLSEEETESIIASVSGGSSALSAQEWRSLSLPLAQTFWTYSGGTMAITGKEDEGWSYRLEILPVLA